MGTTEGLNWLMEQWESQERGDAEFLLKHGWTKDGDYWIKGDKRLYAFDTDKLGAVSVEIETMSRTAGWRQVVIDIHVPACKGDKQDKRAYFVSPKTNRLYHWFEMSEVFYADISEAELKSLTGMTEELNVLFPDEKPDIIKVEFGRFDGKFQYRRHD